MEAFGMNTLECSNLTGIELMGENVTSRLRRCGEGVRLYPLAKLCKPEVIELGSFCRIRDFVFIWGGQSVRIGSYTDIQPHVVIWGGGVTEIGDYVSVGVGSVLLTAVYDHKCGLRMVDGLGEGETKTLLGTLTIQSDAYIGAHCTIMPDVTVGEGAVIGAHSLVLKDIEPWSINVGSPCKKIGERPKCKMRQGNR
jgi:dTDP-4-amino-4,6-dideoxy-D-glucose acyltransferase